jgi:hypothetical protein
MVPAPGGLTDQVSEPPKGGLGVNEAVNAIVVPAVTMLDGGVTETWVGVDAGLEKPPPRQPARRIAKTGSARAIRLGNLMAMLII